MAIREITTRQITIEEANQMMIDAIKAWQRAKREEVDYSTSGPNLVDLDHVKLGRLWRATVEAENVLMDF